MQHFPHWLQSFIFVGVSRSITRGKCITESAFRSGFALKQRWSQSRPKGSYYLPVSLPRLYPLFATSLFLTSLASSMDIGLELSEIIGYYCRRRAAGVGVKVRLGEISSDVSVSRRINNNGLYFVLH